MDTFSGEISIAELTALLFIVSLTFIPLTIWGVWYLEQNGSATIGRHPLASIGSFQPSSIVNIAVALRGHSEWQPAAIVLPR